MPWTEEDDQFFEKGSASKKPPLRTPWQRFKDQFIAGALHSPLGAEGIVRYGTRLGNDPEKLNRVERQLSEQFATRDAADEEHFKDAPWDAKIGKFAVDLIGNIIGGVDPTYVVSPGSTAARRIAAQGAINAGVNAGSQGVEIKRGVRDEFSVPEVALNAAAGVGFQGVGEIASRAAGTRRALKRGQSEGFLLPVEGRITSGFGQRKAPKAGASTNHGGIDIAAPIGTPVLAPAGGTVSNVGRGHAKRGNWVEIDHGDGHTTRYLHLSGFNVKPGQTVERGDLFARVGKTGNVTGPHLHWSVYRNGKPVDPRSAKFGQRSVLEDAPAPSYHLNPDNIRTDAEFQPTTIRDYEDEVMLQNIREQQDDILRQADDSDNIVDFNTVRQDKITRDLYEHMTGEKAPEDLSMDDMLGASRNKFKEDEVGGVLTPYERAVEQQNRDVLTPAERQEMDASVRPEDMPPPVDPYHEKFTQYNEKPPTPVNDSETFKSLEEFLDQDGNIRPEWRFEARKFAEAARKRGDPVADWIEARLPERDLRVVKEDDIDPTPPKGGGGGKGRFRQMLDDDSGSYRDRLDDDGIIKSWEDLSAEEKLIKATKRLKPINAETRKLRHEESSRRASSLANIQREGGGLEGYYRERAALKGKMPEAEYESIAKNFTEQDFTELLRKIQTSNSLLPYERHNAETALLKLLGSEGAKRPTDRDLRLLSEVFSPDFIEAMMVHRPLAEKIWHYGVSSLNIPRALMASADISAPFRQGIFLIGRKEFWKSLVPMFKVLFSEANSKALIAEIKSRPSYKLMKEGHLAITDPHNHFLLDNEEDFMTDLAEKIPIWGEVVKASNRAYSGFLNRLRADYFDHLLTKYQEAGINLANDPKRLRGMAGFINSATGRGDLKFGKSDFNNAAPVLNAVFFSPRLIKARIDMLNPATYLQQDPIVRKEAWKNLMALGGAAVAVASLASWAGMDVETDPRHPDFMKPKVGNRRYDILGGFQQYIRLGAQLATSTKITGKGEEKDLYGGRKGVEGKGPYDESLVDVLGRFFRSKENPAISFAHNYLAGENVIGEPFNRSTPVAGVPIPEELLERIIPMSAGDIAEAYADAGFTGAVAATPALVGVGVQTYEPRKSKPKKEKKLEDEFADIEKSFETKNDEPEDLEEWFSK